MNVSPDQTILLDLGVVKINATLVFTWLTMALLAGLARWSLRIGEFSKILMPRESATRLMPRTSLPG